MLHGSVGEGVALGLLEERLRGCTDSMDSFFDHEAHYTMGRWVGRLYQSIQSSHLLSYQKKELVYQFEASRHIIDGAAMKLLI